MRQLLFEMKKMTRTRLLFFLAAGTLLLIGAIFIRNVLQQDMVTAEKVESFSNHLQDVSSQNRTDLMMMEDEPSEELELRLNKGLDLQDKLNELIDSISKGLWEDELQGEIEVSRSAMAYKDARGRYTMSHADLEDTIRLNEQLLALGLPKEDPDRSNQPPLFMKQMMVLVLNPVGYTVLFLLLGISITREFEDRNMRMVYAFPVPRWRLVLVKFISLLLVAMSWLVYFLLLSYLLPNLVMETREQIFDYPLLLTSGELMRVGSYINEAVLYSAGTLFFATAMVTLIGFGFRQTIVSSVIITALFTGGWMLARNGMDVFLNPFTYVSGNQVILSQPAFYPGGILVLLIVSIVLLFAAMWSNQRRGVAK
ncbi:ABC transporter permease subunit [Sporosarcina cyprini]|uniref:ABC transporter permease subunit n=1 Tax=Sporosarcina cyprini TaxID=2910523 RepID=UPI001EE06283|nr:ABC transporter permease subunit [Sporosarcina cyprini]MCG3087603.1 ABC transporter permease subunit [Sporosarcina cyprini]